MGMRKIFRERPEEPAPGPAPEYMDRINVGLEDRTSWNLQGANWTREKFLAEMKTHSWIKVGSSALVQISKVVDVRFFPKETDRYATKDNCSEFEFE